MCITGGAEGADYLWASEAVLAQRQTCVVMSFKGHRPELSTSKGKGMLARRLKTVFLSPQELNDADSKIEEARLILDRGLDNIRQRFAFHYIQ